MPNNMEVKSNRERYTERLKAKYPDREFADDEALFGQINDDYDGYDKELSGYKEREKALSDLFASNPQVPLSLLTGEKAKTYHRYGAQIRDDFKAALEDPEKQEALAAANKEFAERIAQEKEYEGEYQKNLDETLTTLETMQQEEGLPDEDIDSAMDFLVGIVRDGIMGKFTRESIEMAIKAIRHDSDVEAAGHEGEVKGRNSKIEEKLRKAGKNDGTADLAGKNGGGSGGSRQMPDLGAIGRYDGTQNIWERGGEKRKAINR